MLTCVRVRVLRCRIKSESAFTTTFSVLLRHKRTCLAQWANRRLVGHPVCSVIVVWLTVRACGTGALFGGYDTAIFAYGNTGAGKTYTMFGDTQDNERKGLVPRILEVLSSAFVFVPVDRCCAALFVRLFSAS